MDLNKVELKYLCGAYRNMDMYPTNIDVLFDIISWLCENGYETETISFNTIKTIFPKNTDMKNLHKSLEYLCENSYLEVVDSNVYRVLINPWS